MKKGVNHSRYQNENFCVSFRFYTILRVFSFLLYRRGTMAQ